MQSEVLLRWGVLDQRVTLTKKQGPPHSKASHRLKKKVPLS